MSHNFSLFIGYAYLNIRRIGNAIQKNLLFHILYFIGFCKSKFFKWGLLTSIGNQLLVLTVNLRRPKPPTDALTFQTVKLW